LGRLPLPFFPLGQSSFVDPRRFFGHAHPPGPHVRALFLILFWALCAVPGSRSFISLVLRDFVRCSIAYLPFLLRSPVSCVFFFSTSCATGGFVVSFFPFPWRYSSVARVRVIYPFSFLGRSRERLVLVPLSPFVVRPRSAPLRSLYFPRSPRWRWVPFGDVNGSF